MATIRASQQGLAKIKQARKEKGWVRDNPKWLKEASKCLEPNWQEGPPYATGISPGTWARFLAGKHPINTPAFKAYCAVLNLDWEEIVDRDIVQKPKADRRCSWGEAPDVSIFYGRTEEIAQLGQWIVKEHCRLVALLGMGGIGKTSLSVKLAQQIQEHFEYVIWRSLRNAPPLSKILAELIQFLSDEHNTNLSKDINGQISRLREHLHQHRCLVILDNLESILLE